MITDRKRISFEFVSDVTKQIVTVAAAIVGLSITFRQDLMKGVAEVPRLLQATVALYMLTVLAGIFVLLALAGALGDEPPSGTAAVPRGAHEAPPRNEGISDEALTIYRPSIRGPFFILLIVFPLAVLGTFLFGWTRYGMPAKPVRQPTYAFARAQLRNGMRCVLTARTDAEAAGCAQLSSDLAFRYEPPPADAAPLIAALEVATTAASAFRPPKKPSVALSANRLNIIDAYVGLDSVLSAVGADSVTAAATH